MKFIQLTRIDRDDNPIGPTWVNVDWISGLWADISGGTHLCIGESGQFDVAEPLDHVMTLINR